MTCFYPALVLFEQSNCIDWINICYIRSLTKISFSDTCWATERNGNNTSADTFENA